MSHDVNVSYITIICAKTVIIIRDSMQFTLCSDIFCKKR